MIETLENRRLFSGGFRVVGYLPDYEYSAVISELNWAALSQINYFSIIPNSNGSLPTTSSGGYSLSQLSSTVTAAHSNGVKIDIDVSGTTFPNIIASTSATNKFLSSISTFCNTYNLDGVDLNWEPDSITATQITEFGQFIAAVQTKLSGLDVSVAVNSSMLSLLNTQAMTAATTINIETYDMDYADNAPLADSESSMQAWASQLTAAGVSISKLNFGLPIYGRYGTSWADSTAETYNDIVNGYIAQTGETPPPGADTLDVAFSDAFSGATEPWSFNGPTTIATKTEFAIGSGYGGVMIWNLGQDHFNSAGQYDQYSLLPVINGVVHSADQLAIAQQPTNAVVGHSIAPAVTIDVEDATGSIVTAGNSSVTLAISSGPSGATLGGTITVAAVNGIATFSNLVLSTAGTYTLAATDGSLTGVTSQAFQIIAGPPAWLGSGSVATFNVSSHTLTVTGTATIIADPGSDLPMIVATGSAAQLSIAPTTATQIHIAGLNLSGGASVTLPAAASIPLILLSGNNVSIDSSSKLDLGNNVLDVQTGSVSALTALVANGFNAAGGGRWNGDGITSTTAGADTTHLTALGCIINNNNTQSPIIASIDGAALSTTDVLIKYTYMGDSNLSGKVDASDYSEIDNGFLHKLTGWANGDFNYDATVNGSDYTLIDNAFNRQGKTLASPAALVSPTTAIAMPPIPVATDLFSRKKLKISLIAAVAEELDTESQSG